MHDSIQITFITRGAERPYKKSHVPGAAIVDSSIRVKNTLYSGAAGLERKTALEVLSAVDIRSSQSRFISLFLKTK